MLVFDRGFAEGGALDNSFARTERSDHFRESLDSDEEDEEHELEEEEKEEDEGNQENEESGENGIGQGEDWDSLAEHGDKDESHTQTAAIDASE